MTASTAPPLEQSAMRVRRRGLVPIVLVVVAGVLLAGWWWGRGPQSWWTARSFIEALKGGDCATAAKYYVGETSSSACSPSSYWLPDDLNGYSLDWDRVGRGKYDDQTAVGVLVPGDNTAYSLHLVRRGVGWVVDEVDATA